MDSMMRRLICFAASAVFIMAGMLTGIAAAEEEPNHGDHTKKTQDNHSGHDGTQAGAMLMVRTEPSDIKPGQPVKFHLIIHDATGAMIKDFETVHEKKLHLIIVRDGLDTFAHIHPEIDSAKNITDTFTFPTAGRYRLYADYKPAGKRQATAIAEVNVAGTSPLSPQLVPNAPGRVKGDGLGADIAIDKTNSEGTTRISFSLFDAAGKPVTDLQPYLGAMGHLIVISGDGKSYVHSHPVEGTVPGGAVAFEAPHFPHPGIYKGWGQLRRSDMVRDVPFVVKVE